MLFRAVEVVKVASGWAQLQVRYGLRIDTASE
jgi:hypothetical protein